MEIDEIRKRNHCNTCKKKWPKERSGCMVFREEPEHCWAWTDDPNWALKINEAIQKYPIR